MPDQRINLFLSKIHIKGFKSIDDLTVDFVKDLNILIGKNGSGKSNFLEFLSFIVQPSFPSRNFRHCIFELSDFDENIFIIEYERETPPLDLVKEGIKDRFQFRQKISYNNQQLYDSDKNEDPQKLIVVDGKRISLRRNLQNLFRSLGFSFPPILYIQFNLPQSLDCIDLPGTIKIEISEDFNSWETPDTVPLLDDLFWKMEIAYDLGDLDVEKIEKKSLLKQLKLKDEIIENLRDYSPIKNVRFNSNINIYKDDDNVIIENLKLEFLIDDSWLPWIQLSDGTKRIFYVISEITNNHSGIVLIEEPELGVHPHQFNLLMDFIKQESESKQIILSTHSPKSLDHLDFDQLHNILISSYHKPNGTLIRHLDKKEEQKAIKYIEEVGFLSDYWLMSDLEK